MKKITLGILAHVDAGKTTLSEAMLYESGQIRTLGRVDKKNAFLDTHSLERDRGITIFSKMAVFALPQTQVYLLDTPGHVDFSAEMERTLQVLDYAVLVISGSEGVQSHTLTLWKLLERYNIPVFLFINKMDLCEPERDIDLMHSFRINLDQNCVDFSKGRDTDSFKEAAAMCDEELLDEYLETGEIDLGKITGLISERKMFPCFFGSALKVDRVKEFLDNLDQLMTEPPRNQAFGARVFKISRDSQGNRLTFMKITGGSLKPRTMLEGTFGALHPEETEGEQTETWKEKVNQIRIYSGEKFERVEEACAGCVCALTGLNFTHPGEGFGTEPDGLDPVLEPVLTYRVLPPSDCDELKLLEKMRALEDEIPELHIVWDEQLKEIHAQVMGEVQIEILKSLISERFGLEVSFDTGRIVYKETIADTVEGVGHFEPLRHYAEVHLLMEPGEPGSGIMVDTDCSEDLLAKNWQRLIVTHLLERQHRGVLIGAPLTDVKITLIAGRAHLKHTMGGDFRQATYRAVRQGLMKAHSVILEPWYAFRMELPMDLIGRAMTDIQAMHGHNSQPEIEGDHYVLQGSAPVSTFQNYQKELNTYSHGRGHVFCVSDGYRPCHDQDEVYAASFYDPETDLRNPPHSVFCSHGSGFVVPWYEVEQYMHIDGTGKRLDLASDMETITQQKTTYEDGYAAEAELMEIFQKTYGGGSGEKKNPYGRSRKAKINSLDVINASSYKGLSRPRKTGKEYLLVDGYNIIHAWPELNELAEQDFGAARGRLMDILSNYQGYVGCILILVFDAYKVKGGQGSITRYNNIDVVYTKEAETADMYIEKTAHRYGRTDKVTVATSDGLEQVIIRGQGCLLLSAKELKEEIEQVKTRINMTVETHVKSPSAEGSGKNYLSDYLDEETRKKMAEIATSNETF